MSLELIFLLLSFHARVKGTHSPFPSSCTTSANWEKDVLCRAIVNKIGQKDSVSARRFGHKLC